MSENKMINFIQKAKNRIFSRKIPAKSIYADFAPIENLSSEEESLKALHWALNNKRIKNIALTGPYGAGKSSVIESYLMQHMKCKAINISLATFDGHLWDKVQELKEEHKYSEAQIALAELEDVLEKGILKQLFYKVDADKIPLSRYRKLHHIRIWKYLVGVLIALGVSTAVTYLIFPDKVTFFIDSYLSGITSIKDAFIDAGAFLIAISGIGYVIRFITSKFTIKEISVGDVSAQGEEISKDSVLNKNIDEMLYFFERTKYNVVFIEDLDRFNRTSIFIKLREINTILNKYEVLKKRIVFVYAVRDDLFKEETERTKFFDFLIPVIPVINSTNSGEIMRNLLGLGDKKEENREYPDHDISQKFITLVSPYIGDMRVLISTINEFWIYKRTLKEGPEVDLVDERMLALMIYKNLYPSDFALLEAENGDIKAAFNYKNEAIKNAYVNLKSRRTQMECVQKDIMKSIKEIKIVILSELTGNEGVVTRIITDSRSIYYSELLSDSYSFDEIRNSSIRVLYRNYNASNEQEKPSIARMEDFSDTLRNLFVRYDAQCVYKDKSTEEVLLEFEKIDREILKLRANTLQQLIKENPKENVLPDKVRENDLLVFSLRHGYINESYADYINYFHSGSISREELNFILSIRNYKGMDDFAFPIKHCSNVADRLYDYEFEQVEALNYNMTDFLLDSKTNEDKLQKLIQQLTNRKEISLKFIKDYIDRGEHIERFIQVLCHKSNCIWVDFLYDEQLSGVKKDYYLKCIIESCEIEDIEKNNVGYEDEDTYSEGIIKDYIEADDNILQKMSDIAWTKIKEVIEALEIKFSILNLEGLKTEIIDYIIEEWRFELNSHMMKEIFQIKKPERVDALFNANYRHVRELGCEALLEYIYDDFPSYVRCFIIGEKSNIEETTEDVEDIIERLYNESKDLCIKVIEKEYLARWNSLTACLCGYEDKEKQEIWDYLLIYNRTNISWDNYLTYRGVFGLTSVLVTFVDSNMDFLLQSQGDEILTDEHIKELLIENLSDDSFKKFIMNYPVEEFTNECSEFSEDKLKIMIIEHYFSFTSERYLELREISRMLSKEFVKENKTEFLKFIDACEISVEDLKDFINLGIFNEKETLLLFEYISVEEVDLELALIIRSFDFLMPKVFIETTWNLLKKEDKYQLLLNQLEIYGLDELAIKFDELGGVYGQFTERSKHKYSLMASDYNIKLCEKLHSMDFLSSKEVIAEKVGFDPIGLKDKVESHVVGYVKRKV